MGELIMFVFIFRLDDLVLSWSLLFSLMTNCFVFLVLFAGLAVVLFESSNGFSLLVVVVLLELLLLLLFSSDVVLSSNIFNKL